jgi:acyl-CoA reductase-like NAD-dependent aldehyde dehydrogenase
MRQLFIDGEWVDAEATTSIPAESSVDGEVIDEVPAGSEQDIRTAVEAARRGQRELEETTAFERATVLAERDIVIEEKRVEAGASTGRRWTPTGTCC